MLVGTLNEPLAVNYFLQKLHFRCTADLVTFTEESLMENFIFCAVMFDKVPNTPLWVLLKIFSEKVLEIYNKTPQLE